MTILSINDWWNTLDSAHQIYWGIAIAGSLFLFILLILAFIGGETDHDSIGSDITDDFDGVGFQFFTLKNLAGFLTVFGWTGLACMQGGMSVFVSSVIAFAAGLAMMFIMAFVFYSLFKLQEDGTMKVDSAVGRTGEVYLNIPASRGGYGKVFVNINGAQREMDALTDDTNDLTRGTIVTVKQVIDQSKLLVTR
jgi:hypothetical protein